MKKFMRFNELIVKSLTPSFTLGVITCILINTASSMQFASTTGMISIVILLYIGSLIHTLFKEIYDQDEHILNMAWYNNELRELIYNKEKNNNG